MEWNDGWPLTAFIGRSRRCCCAVDFVAAPSGLEFFSYDKSAKRKQMTAKLHEH